MAARRCPFCPFQSYVRTAACPVRPSLASKTLVRLVNRCRPGKGILLLPLLLPTVYSRPLRVDVKRAGFLGGSLAGADSTEHSWQNLVSTPQCVRRTCRRVHCERGRRGCGRGDRTSRGSRQRSVRVQSTAGRRLRPSEVNTPGVGEMGKVNDKIGAGDTTQAPIRGSSVRNPGVGRQALFFWAEGVKTASSYSIPCAIDAWIVSDPIGRSSP